MQTCTLCNHQCADTELVCANCQASLKEHSTTAVRLKKFIQNPRVRAVRISVGTEACPVCRQSRGTYELDEVPTLPINGCSNETGCLCSYEPLLNSVHP